MAPACGQTLLEEGKAEEAQLRPGELPCGATTAAALERLYSWEGVPPAVQAAVQAGIAEKLAALGLPLAGPGRRGQQPVSFLDHAWGRPPPQAQLAAFAEAAALWQLGNPAWDLAFATVLPAASANVRALLRIPEGAASVQWGHNSHELTVRLLSSLPPAAGSATNGGGSPRQQQLHVLTSDAEFYSLTRQLNRAAEAGWVRVAAVPSEPASSFPERCCVAVAAAAAAGNPFSAVCVSQISFTQRTLLPDVAAFVEGALAAAAAGPGPPPLLVIDGYHGFAAVPTDLSAVADRCCYVGGLLKHAGCGPNAAFASVPAALAARLRPVLTGWLADPSVLAPGGDGARLGSEVGYCPDVALMGGTPAFLLPLLLFNAVCTLWRQARPVLSVDSVHAHVLALQERLVAGLAHLPPPAGAALGLLVPLQPAPSRSHTLVFGHATPGEAAAAVGRLRAAGLLVDCRGPLLRVGLGPYHTAADVDALLEALAVGEGSAQCAALA